jgi:hypothetical protein
MNQLTDFYKLAMNIMTVGSSSMTSYFNFRTVGVKNMAGASLWGTGLVGGDSKH